jgi:hypothetical protein
MKDPKHMANWRLLRTAIMAACLLLTAVPLGAQTSVQRLRVKLEAGSSVEVPAEGQAIDADWLKRATSLELAGATLSAAAADSRSRQVEQRAQPRRSWMGRHPVLVGSLVGFGTGFLLGYLPGDDVVFYDYTAEFNGLVLGGVGAGTGALVGAIVGAKTK